ncbi:MAG: hypothetical protein ABI317_15920 [Gaiellales bacterium]
MTDERVRFEIGFKGGGSTGGELPPDQVARLEAALSAGNGGLVELAGDGSHWWIRVEDVSWLRRGERDRKLGFGST